MINEQLVKEVAHVRKHAPREAEEAVLKQRKARRASVRSEIEELTAAKEAEHQREQEAKNDRVKQLRALHHVHRQNPKVFDPTESAGIGLLDEMSLVEMHERLEINKVMDSEKVDRKRDEIAAAKHDKQTDLARRLANIKQLREEAMVQLAGSLDERREAERQAKAELAEAEER